MRKGTVAAAVVLGSVFAAGCADNPLVVEESTLAASDPSLAISSGETFSYIRITDPTVKSVSATVGGSRQMVATLYYSAGGTLNGVPYANWRSTDPCVATVTSASPSWGLVRGVKTGTTQIIADAWGKADTVTVKVTGSGDLDPGCDLRQWVWDWNDVSFTGTPASTYFVASGEKLSRVVLFAGPKPDWTIARGSTVTLRSELWYDGGGKRNGRGYVTFSSFDHSVVTISSKGVVTGHAPGRAKIVARLGNLADTVPIFVR